MRTAAIATLIATAAGTGAWLLGFPQKLWPDHPMWATFLLTVFTYVVVRYSWPRNHPQ